MCLQSAESLIAAARAAAVVVAAARLKDFLSPYFPLQIIIERNKYQTRKVRLRVSPWFFFHFARFYYPSQVRTDKEWIMFPLLTSSCLSMVPLWFLPLIPLSKFCQFVRLDYPSQVRIDRE